MSDRCRLSFGIGALLLGALNLFTALRDADGYRFGLAVAAFVLGAWLIMRRVGTERPETRRDAGLRVGVALIALLIVVAISYADFALPLVVAAIAVVTGAAVVIVSRIGG